MSGYDLRYETRESRCAWCWENIDGLTSHTVVAALRSPYIELRFHHDCWPVYRACSGIEGRQRDALYREWSPQRVDMLRMHAGLNQNELAAKLHIQKEKLIAFLRGDCRLGQRSLALLRDIAVHTKFEWQDPDAIDWSDRRACFCLAMHCGWNAREMAFRLDVLYATITAWWDRGVPKQSVRYWTQLNVVARQHRFDARMIIDDYLWTREFLKQAIAQSGYTKADWVRAGQGQSSFFVAGSLHTAPRINPKMAFHLTKAAMRLGAPLPQKGYIEPKRRPPRPFPGGCAGPQGARIWKPEELALLGTKPDRVIAAELGTRTYIAVRHMRRSLGIAPVPKRRWSGKPIAASFPLEEVLARYEARLRGESSHASRTPSQATRGPETDCGIALT